MLLLSSSCSPRNIQQAPTGCIYEIKIYNDIGNILTDYSYHEPIRRYNSLIWYTENGQQHFYLGSDFDKFSYSIRIIKEKEKENAEN